MPSTHLKECKITFGRKCSNSKLKHHSLSCFAFAKKTGKTYHVIQAFTSNSALKTHQMVHTREKPFQCEECGAKFASNSHLKSHIDNRHLGIKRFHCTQCPMKYNRPDQFRKHVMTHTGETPHKCNFCGKGFRRKDTLKKHEVVHFPDEDKYRFPCSECGKRFTQQTNLKTHMKSHHPHQAQHQQRPEQHQLQEDQGAQLQDLQGREREQHVQQN